MAADRSLHQARTGTLSVVLTALLTATALLFASSASAAALEFCPPGSGAGQCGSPSSLRGLAVDSETGHLYVADQGNNRIDVFDEAGTFIFAFGWGVDTGAATLQTCTTASTCQAGIAGSTPGQLDEPGRIAVDNDPASPTLHAIYVAEDKNHRVQKFDATGAFLWAVGSSGEAEGQLTTGIFPGVGPGGVLYVLDNPQVIQVTFKHRLQRFEPSGVEIPSQCFPTEEAGKATGLAVEAGGDFWVANILEGKGIHKYDASCAPLLGGATIDSGLETNFLALGGAGQLSEQREFKDERPGRYEVITSYDASGNHLRRFGYDQLELESASSPEGLTGAPAGTFVSVGNAGIRLLLEPPPGPVIAPSSLEASAQSVWAGIGAEVNPEGKATEYEVLYVDQHSYETEGGFASPNTRQSEALQLSAADFSIHSIQEAIAGCKPFSQKALEEGKCLKPETKYRYLLKTENEDGESQAEGTFTTQKPIEVRALYVSEVGTDGITLNAEVDPLGSPATGFFQYIDEAGYEAGIRAAEEEGKTKEEAEAQGRGFDAAAEAPAGAGKIDFGAGEGTVRRRAQVYPLAPGTTYRYRLIATDNFATLSSETKSFRTLAAHSPEAGSCPANEAFRSGPSASLPDCRAYELVSPLDKGGSDIRVLETNGHEPAVLEQSSESGDSLAFGSVRAFGDAASAPWTSQYIAQRIAGAEWQTHSIDSPRIEDGTGSPLAQADTEFKYFSPDLCDTWQIPYAEPPLSAGALTGFHNLYRRTDRLCGSEGYEALAPRGKPGLAPGAGGFVLELEGVSADGTHAIFRSNGKLAPGGKAGSFQLYESVRGASPRFVCLKPGGAPVAGGCTAGSGPRAETRGTNVSGAISKDGQRIYWTDEVEDKLYVRIGGTQTLDVSKAAEDEAKAKGSSFWGAASDGSRAIFTTGGRLYRFTLAGAETQLLAEGVIGVMGMSEDANRVYFASSKALAAGAQEGKPNLYLYEASGGGGGSTSFIATLAAGDVNFLVKAPVVVEPHQRSARVTPDGLHAAFTSLAPLSGYDNADASTGEATKEVYLYQAAAKKLLCASCNPSGARPRSVATEGTRFSARIPGFETQMHAAHVLSDNGSRLYFESADTLSPADSNGAVDVYQWEAPGAGSCKAASPSFSPQDEGCIDLISSGQSPIDSRFVEATADGRDVFFATLSSLLPQDYGLIDIYDARAGGGLPMPSAAASCEGEACQSPPAPPNDPTPGSSSFEGAGNVNEAGAKPCKRGKVRRGGKCVKPKAHKKKAHRKHKRHAQRGRGG